MTNTKRKLKKPDAGILLYDIAMALAALMTGLFILLVVLPHEKSKDTAAPMQGSICSEIYWDNNRDIDLDLYSLSPVDKNPVYYLHMHDRGTDLFKDVIGFMGNPEHINMEIACTNALYPGEYIYDVAYFANHEISVNGQPVNNDIKVNMIIRIKSHDSIVYTINSDYTFHNVKQDKTILSFKIDKFGSVVVNSANSVDRFIRDRKLQ